MLNMKVCNFRIHYENNSLLLLWFVISKTLPDQGSEARLGHKKLSVTLIQFNSSIIEVKSDNIW